jgi:hypothetical protein
MADAFALTGSYTTTPNTGAPSLLAGLGAPIDEEFQISEKALVAGLDLSVDSAVVIPFGSVTNANIVIIKSPVNKVKARLTSADGSVQAIPVDGVLILISQTVPFTALDLTRLPGVDTVVDVFLGQIA